MVTTQPRPATLLTPVMGATSYRLFVYANGQNLTTAEIQRRYRLETNGETTLTPEGLREVIRSHELREGSPPAVYVRLHTRQHGRQEEVWLWPEM